MRRYGVQTTVHWAGDNMPEVFCYPNDITEWDAVESLNQFLKGQNEIGRTVTRKSKTRAIITGHANDDVVYIEAVVTWTDI